MKKPADHLDRRGFIKTSTALTAGIAGLALFPNQCRSMDEPGEGINIIGPRQGFSPQVGTLFSMMDWMRMVVLSSVSNMAVDELDYLHDPQSNTIGAMLLHLAATERYYQLHTFGGTKWGAWDQASKKQWDIPMSLGDQARKTIRDNKLEYYVNTLQQVREVTVRELRNRDDKWLLTVDSEWSWGPTNNYCKWFHVCEHESNHNGQIKWIKSRLSGRKGGVD